MTFILKTANQIKRLKLIIYSLSAIACGLVILFYTLSDYIVLYYTPSEFYDKIGDNHANKTFKIGGLVKERSIKRAADSTIVSFIIRDAEREISVDFDGIPPALFGENNGVIAEGVFDDKMVLHSKLILAKHDENYVVGYSVPVTE